MNSLQILEALQNDIYSKKFFKGVVAIDQLPKTIKKIKSSAYVVNSEKSYEDGEHWFSIFWDKNSNCEFFDSLNMGPTFYGLDNFLLKTSNSVIYNNIQIQSFLSQYCGYYALLFILSRSRNIKFLDFLEYFDYDTLKNDFKIKKFIDFYKFY